MVGGANCEKYNKESDAVNGKFMIVIIANIVKNSSRSLYFQGNLADAKFPKTEPPRHDKITLPLIDVHKSCSSCEVLTS